MISDTLMLMTIRVSSIVKKLTGLAPDEAIVGEVCRAGIAYFSSDWHATNFALDVLVHADSPKPHWLLDPDGTPVLNGGWEEVCTMTAMAASELCPGVELEVLAHEARRHMIACHRSGDVELMELAPDFIDVALQIEFGR